MLPISNWYDKLNCIRISSNKDTEEILEKCRNRILNLKKK